MSSNISGITTPISPSDAGENPTTSTTPSPFTGSSVSSSTLMASEQLTASSSTPALTRISILDYSTALSDSFLHLLRVSKEIDLTNSLVSFLQGLSAMSGLALTDAQINGIVQNFEDASEGVNDAQDPTANLDGDAADLIGAYNSYNAAKGNYSTALNNYKQALADYKTALAQKNSDPPTISDEDFAAAQQAYSDAEEQYNEARSDLLTAATHYNNAVTKYKLDKASYTSAINILNEKLIAAGKDPVSISGLISDSELNAAFVNLLPDDLPEGSVDVDPDDLDNVNVPDPTLDTSKLSPPSLPEISFAQFIQPWLKDGAAAAAFAKAQNESQQAGQDFELLSLILMARGDPTPTSANAGNAPTSKNTVNLVSTPSPQASFLATLVSGLGSSDSVTQISNENLAAALSSEFKKTPADLLLRAKYVLRDALQSASLFGITAKLDVNNEVLSRTNPTTHTAAMAIALGPAASLLGMASSPQLEESIKNALYTSQDFTLLSAAEQNTVINLLTTAVGLSLLSTTTALLGSSGVAPSLLVNSLLTGLTADLSRTNASTATGAIKKRGATAPLSGKPESIKGDDSLKAIDEDELLKKDAKSLQFYDYLDTELKAYLDARSSKGNSIPSQTLFEFLASRFPPLTNTVISKKSFQDLRVRLTSQFSETLAEHLKDPDIVSKKSKQIADILVQEVQKYNNSPTSLAGRMHDLREEIAGILTPGVSLDQARDLATTLTSKGFISLANVQLRDSFEGHVGRSTAQALSDEVTNTLIKRDQIAHDLITKVIETNNREFLKTSIDLLTNFKVDAGTLALLEPAKTFDGLMHASKVGFQRGNIDIQI